VSNIFKTEFTDLWNDLPKDERSRLMPYMIEKQKRHFLQMRQVAEKAHKAQLKEIDDWIKNLDSDLHKYKNQLNNPQAKTE